jgi:phosphoribosylanthranilate isomerase
LIKRTPSFVQDMRTAAAEAMAALNGVEWDQFARSRLLQAAVERWVMIIGEAANRIPMIDRAQMAGVQWNRIIGMRHRLVHGYDGVDVEVVFDVGKQFLPELSQQLVQQPFLTKICGVTTIDTMESAIGSLTTAIGLNFHPKSPRNVSIEQASILKSEAAGLVSSVALIVDFPDADIAAIRNRLRPDFFQLHGSETPQRVFEIGTLVRTPIIKAIGISSPADLAIIPDYAKVADAILLDAKPPKDAAYPGGHGRPFDWSILKAMDPKQPFILSGGLTPENVAEAITMVRGYGLNLIGVDVSSGVESAPGVKDAAKIQSFVAAARGAASAGPS